MQTAGKPRMSQSESSASTEAQHLKRKSVIGRFVAPYLDGLGSSSDRRLIGIKIITSVALLCGFGLSWRLWVSSRLFPLCPVTGLLPVVSSPIDWCWFAALLGLLVAIVIVERPRRLILFFLALAASLSLLDQNRWQPWFYQYLFILAAIGFNADKRNEPGPHISALDTIRLIIVSTYFWSGLQKLNAGFAKETWSDIAGSFLRVLPEKARHLPAALVFVIPLAEMAIGLGLATRRFRRAAVVSAITTHIFVLVLLVSSGENVVVWPWNIAMILAVLVLFWRDEETTLRRIVVPRSVFHAIVLLLFAVMPVFSFVDLWDSYLSSALYSGNTDQAVIYVSPEVIARLPVAVRPHVWQSSNPFFLDINRWSYGELNVPLYPEPRVYKRVAKDICGYAGNFSSDVRLRIKQKPNPFTADRKSEFYDCDHLE